MCFSFFPSLNLSLPHQLFNRYFFLIVPSAATLIIKYRILLLYFHVLYRSTEQSVLLRKKHFLPCVIVQSLAHKRCVSLDILFYFLRAIKGCLRDQGLPLTELFCLSPLAKVSHHTVESRGDCLSV